jgi:hypothetical protein
MAGFYVVVPISMPLGGHPWAVPAPNFSVPLLAISTPLLVMTALPVTSVSSPFTTSALMTVASAWTAAPPGAHIFSPEEVTGLLVHQANYMDATNTRLDAM